MKESRKMELTMYFSKNKFQPSHKQKMSNKYLFFKKLYGNYAIYFVKKISLILNWFLKISICTAVKE